MANQQQLDLLKQGRTATWNRWREDHPDTALELNGVDLSGADLGEVDLAHADLSRTDLSGADLNNANLSEANLAGANLSAANLVNATMYRADLSDANLICSYLSKHCHANDSVVFADGKQGARNREDKGADKVESLF